MKLIIYEFQILVTSSYNTLLLLPEFQYLTYNFSSKSWKDALRFSSYQPNLIILEKTRYCYLSNYPLDSERLYSLCILQILEYNLKGKWANDVGVCKCSCCQLFLSDWRFNAFRTGKEVHVFSIRVTPSHLIQSAVTGK